MPANDKQIPCNCQPVKTPNLKIKDQRYRFQACSVPSFFDRFSYYKHSPNSPGATNR